MKKVLVTGAAGFIGSHLVDYILTTTDWSVVCLDRLDYAGNLNRLVQMESFEKNPTRRAVVFHDLRASVSGHKGEELLKPRDLNLQGRARLFDYVIHLAAGSHVDRSVKDPGSFVFDNVVGTLNLLDACRGDESILNPNGKFLYFSTDEVFGPAEHGQCFAEDARMNPNNPYAAAKAGGELLCPAFANTYGMRIVVTRCANVFGERQDPEKFIPLCIRKILNQQTIQIHAKRLAIPVDFEVDRNHDILATKTIKAKLTCETGWIPSSRLYTYHRNVTSAVVKILEEGDVIQGEDASTGRYNIEGGEEQTNVYVAEQIAKLLGRKLSYELVEDPPGRPRPDMRYSLDSSRLRALGWKPEIDFHEGLRRTVESETRA